MVSQTKWVWDNPGGVGGKVVRGLTGKCLDKFG